YVALQLAEAARALSQVPKDVRSPRAADHGEARGQRAAVRRISNGVLSSWHHGLRGLLGVTKRKAHSSVTASSEVYFGNFARWLWTEQRTHNQNMDTTTQATATAAALRARNLAVEAPRSPRCALGGYAILPRLLDKCR